MLGPNSVKRMKRFPSAPRWLRPLFPLDGPRRFARPVVDDAVDAEDFVDDAFATRAKNS